MSNKHVKHQGKKEKARRLAQIKKRAAAKRKQAPKKRPMVQESEPLEAIAEVAANIGQPDSPTPRQLAVLTNITGSDE